MDISHLLEEPDIHARYLDRLRAERLAKVLWQLTQEHIHWKTVSTSAPLEARGDMGGGGTSGGAGFAGVTPFFLDFEVPPVPALAFEGESWCIWRGSYIAALQSLPLEQREALQEHVLRTRYSAVFATNKREATVRRSVSASPELAAAALKMLGICEKQKS